MYIIEITDTAGNEIWWAGAGWYWTNQWFQMQGPYLTKDGAAYDYAWHINAAMDNLSDNWVTQ